MKVNNIIRIEGDFSIRSQIDMRDVSQIFTNTLDTTYQWNRLIVEKLLQDRIQDISIHICPWRNEDWKQYLALAGQVKRIVVWLSDQMPLIDGVNENTQIVQYTPIDYSERFVVVKATGVARALVSWNEKSYKNEEGSFQGVFISSPAIANKIATTLENKLERDQF